MSESSSSIVAYLTSLSDDDRADALHRCCGSRRWAKELSARILSERIEDHDQLFALSDLVWANMDKADYLEAFTHHPKIGADPDQLRERFRTTHTWSKNEQSGMSSASEETIQSLVRGNTDYLEKFGYIFIVCATGKSADEMLALLQARLPNDPADEINLAAAEQAKITRIRMEKLS